MWKSFAGMKCWILIMLIYRLALLNTLLVSTFTAYPSFVTWTRKLSSLVKLYVLPAPLLVILSKALYGNATPGYFRSTENKRSSRMALSSLKTSNEWAIRLRTRVLPEMHKDTALEEHWKFKLWVSFMFSFAIIFSSSIARHLRLRVN